MATYDEYLRSLNPQKAYGLQKNPQQALIGLLNTQGALPFGLEQDFQTHLARVRAEQGPTYAAQGRTFGDPEVANVRSAFVVDRQNDLLPKLTSDISRIVNAGFDTEANRLAQGFGRPFNATEITPIRDAYLKNLEMGIGTLGDSYRPPITTTAAAPKTATTALSNAIASVQNTATPAVTTPASAASNRAADPVQAAMAGVQPTAAGVQSVGVGGYRSPMTNDAATSPATFSIPTQNFLSQARQQQPKLTDADLMRIGSAHESGDFKTLESLVDELRSKYAMQGEDVTRTLGAREDRRGNLTLDDIKTFAGNALKIGAAIVKAPAVKLLFDGLTGAGLTTAGIGSVLLAMTRLALDPKRDVSLGNLAKAITGFDQLPPAMQQTISQFLKDPTKFLAGSEAGAPGSSGSEGIPEINIPPDDTKPEDDDPPTEDDDDIDLPKDGDPCTTDDGRAGTLIGGICVPTARPGGEVVEINWKNQKASCEMAGGTWDDANKVCLMPTKVGTGGGGGDDKKSSSDWGSFIEDYLRTQAADVKAGQQVFGQKELFGPSVKGIPQLLQDLQGERETPVSIGDETAGGRAEVLATLLRQLTGMDTAPSTAPGITDTLNRTTGGALASQDALVNTALNATQRAGTVTPQREAATPISASLAALEQFLSTGGTLPASAQRALEQTAAGQGAGTGVDALLSALLQGRATGTGGMSPRETELTNLSGSAVGNVDTVNRYTQPGMQLRNDIIGSMSATAPNVAASPISTADIQQILQELAAMQPTTGAPITAGTPNMDLGASNRYAGVGGSSLESLLSQLAAGGGTTAALTGAGGATNALQNMTTQVGASPYLDRAAGAITAPTVTPETARGTGLMNAGAGALAGVPGTSSLSNPYNIVSALQGANTKIPVSGAFREAAGAFAPINYGTAGTEGLRGADTNLAPSAYTQAAAAALPDASPQERQTLEMLMARAQGQPTAEDARADEAVLAMSRQAIENAIRNDVFGAGSRGIGGTPAGQGIAARYAADAMRDSVNQIALLRAERQREATAQIPQLLNQILARQSSAAQNLSGLGAQDIARAQAGMEANVARLGTAADIESRFGAQRAETELAQQQSVADVLRSLGTTETEAGAASAGLNVERLATAGGIAQEGFQTAAELGTTAGLRQTELGLSEIASARQFALGTAGLAAETQTALSNALLQAEGLVQSGQIASSQLNLQRLQQLSDSYQRGLISANELNAQVAQFSAALGQQMREAEQGYDLSGRQLGVAAGSAEANRQVQIDDLRLRAKTAAAQGQTAEAARLTEEANAIAGTRLGAEQLATQERMAGRELVAGLGESEAARRFQQATTQEEQRLALLDMLQEGGIESTRILAQLTEGAAGRAAETSQSAQGLLQRQVEEQNRAMESRTGMAETARFAREELAATVGMRNTELAAQASQFAASQYGELAARQQDFGLGGAGLLAAISQTTGEQKARFMQNAADQFTNYAASIRSGEITDAQIQEAARTGRLDGILQTGQFLMTAASTYEGLSQNVRNQANDMAAILADISRSQKAAELTIEQLKSQGETARADQLKGLWTEAFKFGIKNWDEVKGIGKDIWGLLT